MARSREDGRRCGNHGPSSLGRIDEIAADQRQAAAIARGLPENNRFGLLTILNRSPMGLLCLVGGASSITAFVVIGFVPPSQLGHQSPLLYALLILVGILAIGILPPFLMDRLRKPGWKAEAASQPPQATAPPRRSAVRDGHGQDVGEYPTGFEPVISYAKGSAAENDVGCHPAATGPCRRRCGG
jgi:hypothetical protein